MENIKLTPKRKEIMELMEFDSILSVLRYYPSKFDIYKSDILSMSKHDSKVTFEGFVCSRVKVEYIANGKMKTSLMLNYRNNNVTLILFNRFNYAKILKLNTPIVATGKYNAFRNEITVSNFFIGSLNGNAKIVPVYSLNSSIKDATYHSFVSYMYKNAIEKDILKDSIPKEFIDKYKLGLLKDAIYNIHFPEDENCLKKANRYLKYEEFLNFCVLGAYKRKMYSISKGIKQKVIDINSLKKFIARLPFTLSDDQKEVTNQIIKDMKSIHTMSRLLQGDVGSGKTIVAIIAMYANYLANCQSALMAPTDILARQHYKTIKEIIKDDNVNIKLLVSDMDKNQKDDVIESLQNGKVDIVVGTHALIQETISFKNLGLAIIDEQHRFGVKQRLALKEKGRQIDVLYMSATPIPRTLASTLYMDMDVSTIEKYPYKERKINTYYINENKIDRFKGFIDRYLDMGKKIYVVCPSIDKSSYDISNVNKIYNELKDKFPHANIAMLHGKLSSEQKNTIMEDFDNDKYQILVSTTVIEVGINVINANMMIIYNAERFGLASIHQLRGRIARDGQVGYCYLLSDDENEDAIDRLTFIAKNNNGFKISEYDLQRRGAGDMLGLAQSGKSPFIIANLIDDFNILKQASADASYIIDNRGEYQDYLDMIRNILHKSEKYVE